MPDRDDHQVLDAFGEATPAMALGQPTPRERRLRRLATTVFWCLALAMIAGRVHFAPALATHAIELAAR